MNTEIIGDSQMRAFLSRAGLRRLREEVQTLTSELEECTRLMGVSANIDNDLRENPEFMQLRTRVQYELPRRISKCQALLREHVLIEDTNVYREGDFSIVQPGSRVLLLSSSGEKRIMIIGGLGDSDPRRGIISYNAPAARTLIDAGVGETVSLVTKGRQEEYTVVKIDRADLDF